MQVDWKALATQSLALFAGLMLALFFPAGTLTWLAGWIYLVSFFGVFLGVNAWLIQHNPALLQERMRLSRPDQQRGDKLLFPLMLILPFVWLIFISLDAMRFHWSPISFWLQGVGFLILLCSFYLFFLTFRENTFLSTVVRVQEERGHSVISTGPYHYVRHPMYAGFLLFMTGTPLLLGSGYGVLLGLAFMILVGRRAVLEEHLLQKELQGYTDYMAKVKYRIVPYIW